MSWLAPIYLAGLAGLALPVLLHLLRRDTSRRMPFSTLLFLRRTPIRISKRSRLQDILLLLLRCAALALLVFAFARPFMDQRDAAAMQRVRKRVVVLVDTSASMRREGLWEQAMRQLQQTLADTNAEDRVAVVCFARGMSPLFDFDAWHAADGDAARQTIQKLAEQGAGWSYGDLGKAIAGGIEMLTQDELDDETRRIADSRQIVLISDMQDGAGLESLQNIEWPSDVVLSIREVEAAKPGNAAMHAVAAPQQQLWTDRPVHRVRLINSPDATSERFRVRWTGASASDQPIDAYVPPGAATVLSVPPPADASIPLVLQVEGDGESFDNVCYMARPRPRTLDVAWIGSDNERDPQSMRFFLERALLPTSMVSPRVVAMDKSVRPPLIVVEGGHAASLDSVLRQRLDEGAVVLYVLLQAGDIKAVNRLLPSGSMTVQPDDADHTAIPASVDLTHPLLLPFADPRYSDFTGIHFWRHRRLDVSSCPAARIVASYDDGDPAWVETPVGRGAIVIMTSGWHPADSELARSSKFVPLIYSMLERGGANAGESRHFYAGEPFPLPPRARSIRTPADQVVTISAEAGAYDDVHEPGLYMIATDDGEQVVAVNIDPRESRTAPMPAERLTAAGAILTESASQPRPQPTDDKPRAAVELEHQQKLWRWLIVAMMGVVLMETVLAARSARQVTPSMEAAP